MVTVPSLPDDVAETFISKLVLKNFVFDDGGRHIPDFGPGVLDVLERLSSDSKKQIFTAKSYDSKCNYEDLEFLGDPAIRLSVSCLIETKHRDLDRGWRNVSRTDI